MGSIRTFSDYSLAGNSYETRCHLRFELNGISVIDEDEFTLGRSSECEYQFAEAELSGKHATIFKV